MNGDALASVASLAARGNPVPHPPERPETDHLRHLRSLLVDRSRLASLPQPEPLIADTLDKATVAMLAGHHGTGKSFTALSWACSIATGHHWLGRTVNPGRVLYVASEGAEGLHGRISAWENAWRAPVTQLDVLPQPWNIATEPFGDTLAAAASGAPYALVVIDTLARCAVGLDENSARDMGLVIDAADRIRRASRACVLLVHHTGKDKTTIRGSSALEAAADTVYTLEKDGVALNLTRTKRKDGPLHDTLTLRLERTETGSCYVHAGRGQDHDLGASEQRLMSAYLSAFADTGASKAELRTVANMPPATFHRALNALVKRGHLVNHAGDTRPFYRKGPTP